MFDFETSSHSFCPPLCSFVLTFLWLFWYCSFTYYSYTYKYKKNRHKFLHILIICNVQVFSFYQNFFSFSFLLKLCICFSFLINQIFHVKCNTILEVDFHYKMHLFIVSHSLISLHKNFEMFCLCYKFKLTSRFGTWRKS